MAHIHIALVGGQLMPIYLGVQATQPDKVYWIHSSQTLQETERLIAEFEGTEQEQFECHPTNPQDIQRVIAQIMLCHEGDHISLNITSGSKMWAYFTAMALQNTSEKSIFYIDQNNQLWNFTSGETKQLHFNAEVSFRLNGNPLTRFDRLDKFTEEDWHVVKQMRKTLNKNKTIFQLIEHLRLNSHLPKHTLKNGNYIKYTKEAKVIEFRIFSSIYTLTSPHVYQLVVNAGWFEAEIAKLLSEWKYAQEVYINCLFPDSNNSPKNEIDIIVNTGTKLLFVECKTQVRSITDIDKFRSAVRNYGGNASKMLFVTNAPLSPSALEKCRDNKMLAFSVGDNPHNTKSELFKLLETELFNINAK